MGNACNMWINTVFVEVKNAFVFLHCIHWFGNFSWQRGLHPFDVSKVWGIELFFLSATFPGGINLVITTWVERGERRRVELCRDSPTMANWNYFTRYSLYIQIQRNKNTSTLVEMMTCCCVLKCEMNQRQKRRKIRK